MTRTLILCEVKYFLSRKEVAGFTNTGDALPYTVTATQSSIINGGEASRAVDGYDSGRYDHKSCTQTKAQLTPWWSVNFGQAMKVYGVEITNRGDCCSERLTQFEVAVTNVYPTKYSRDDVVVSVGAETFKGKRNFKFTEARTGRKLVIRFKDTGEKRFLTLCEVKPQMNALVNATQSSIRNAGYPSRAVDGIYSGNFWAESCSHTNYQRAPWWSFDFRETLKLYGVEITNREDCCSERLTQFEVAVTNVEKPGSYSSDDVVVSVGDETFKGTKKFKFTEARSGRKLVIRFKDTGKYRFLTLCEVKPLTNAADVAGL